MYDPLPCTKQSVFSCPFSPAPRVKLVMFPVKVTVLIRVAVENVGVAENVTVSPLAKTLVTLGAVAAPVVLTVNGATVFEVGDTQNAMPVLHVKPADVLLDVPSTANAPRVEA